MSAYREELINTSGSTMRDGERNEEEAKRREQRKEEQERVEREGQQGGFDPTTERPEERHSGF